MSSIRDEFITVYDKLLRDHNELKEGLKEVQETNRFYQTHYLIAEQIVKATKQGYAEMPRAEVPDFRTDPVWRDLMRYLVRIICFRNWNRCKQPTHITKYRQGVDQLTREAVKIQPFYKSVQEEIKELKRRGLWRWSSPGKRTIDRTVNYCADAREWEGSPPLLCLKAGLYCPSPQMFQDEVKEELLRLSEEWRK